MAVGVFAAVHDAVLDSEVETVTVGVPEGVGGITHESKMTLPLRPAPATAPPPTKDTLPTTLTPSVTLIKEEPPPPPDG